MNDVNTTNNYESDLIGTFKILLKGKWIIFAFIIIFLLITLYFQNNQPPANYNASTEIKQISTFEHDKYRFFNMTTDIFNIDRDKLFDLFIETIEEGTLIERGVDELNFFDQNNFLNKDHYYKSVNKFSSEVEIIEKNGSLFLNGQFYDKEKWIEFLEYLNREANLLIRDTVIDRFEKVISVLNQQRNFDIEDLDTKIDNAINDYERITKDKLAYLEEQATIARNLGIEKGIIDSQYNIRVAASSSSNVENESNFDANNFKDSYYLFGYEPIEEEIKLIKSRENKTAFIDNLFALEQAKRTLEQDKKLERAQLLLKTAPISSKNDFYAVTFDIEGTEYKLARGYEFVMLSAAVVIGALIGSSFVFILNFFKNFRHQIKKS